MDIVKTSKAQQSSIFPSKKQSMESLGFSRLKHGPILVPDRQSKFRYWVLKNSDVIQEDFSNLWIVSRLFEFNEWLEIAKILKDYFQSRSYSILCLRILPY